MSAVLKPQAETPETLAGIEVVGRVDGQDALLTPAALAFLAGLHRRFEAGRQARLAARVERQARYDAGALPDFREDTAAIRTRRGFTPGPGRFRRRATTTWCLSVCRFFFPL